MDLPYDLKWDGYVPVSEDHYNFPLLFYQALGYDDGQD